MSTSRQYHSPLEERARPSAILDSTVLQEVEARLMCDPDCVEDDAFVVVELRRELGAGCVIKVRTSMHRQPVAFEVPVHLAAHLGELFSELTARASAAHMLLPQARVLNDECRELFADGVQ